MGRDRLGPRAACDTQESEAADYKERKGAVKRLQGASKYSLKDNIASHSENMPHFL